MTKQEFTLELQGRLKDIPEEYWVDCLKFYIEMMDEVMDEGLSEEEAVAKVGSIEEIITQILADVPLSALANKKMKRERRMRWWEILFLVLGSPIWISLAVSVIAVICSLYAAIWSGIISLWAVFVSFAASAVGCLLGGIAFIGAGDTLFGIALIGGGCFIAGLTIFWFFACKALTKGWLYLTKKLAIGIKKCFLRKEATL